MPKPKLKLDTGIPAWLAVMRAITGTTETPGSADNPKIMGMADYIAKKYPHQAEYASYYTGDDVAWCGLTAAFCAAVADVEPPFGKTDTDRWMWAQSFGNSANWAAEEIDEPCLGCFAAMSREGGGHITLVEAWSEGSDTFTSGGQFKGRGGNQSDMINVSTQNVSQVIAWMWPKGFKRPSGGGLKRPELAKGDSGQDVAKVQASLLIPADGDFGPVTEAAVEAFQKAHGLQADGVVGTTTWRAIDELNKKMREGEDGIAPDLARAIDDAVDRNKKVQALSWKDRGQPPKGYYNGMAKSFAVAMTLYSEGDEGAEIMAHKASADPEHDALTYYAKEFQGHKMSNAADGVATLRHLFCMMVGLGMRESSGNPWEGRDMSATNVESETCEAGLFQTSWNISNFAEEEIGGLLEEYWGDPNGFQSTFAEGVEPSTTNLDLYGSGDGAKYQWLAKQSPAFAVLVTAIGMRKGRKHWGPIERREVEISSEIDDMLSDVQELVEDMEPKPDPKRKKGKLS
jgi:hypothetical protein